LPFARAYATIATMSLESNKTIIRRLVEEVINGGDLEAFDELIAPDYVDLSLDPPFDLGERVLGA
jgi:hypothetical protein